MNDLIFKIKDQIYMTSTLMVAFFKKINWLTAIVFLAALTVLFFRRWEFRKILSLFCTWFILIIIYVRLEAFFLSTFAADAADLGVTILRIVSGFIAAAIFLYHASVVQ